MIIEYKIDFFSFWICSAGFSPILGNKALATKDSDGLPYIPGKTIKGILKENVKKMIDWKYSGDDESQNCSRNMLKEACKSLFGCQTKTGTAHFSDATLPEEERSYIISTGTQRFLFFETAHQNSTNKQTYELEVVIPCTLYGYIYIPSQTYNNISVITDLFHDSFGYIKRIGLHRKTGYGRCQIQMTNQPLNKE